MRRACLFLLLLVNTTLFSQVVHSPAFETAKHIVDSIANIINNDKSLIAGWDESNGLAGDSSNVRYLYAESSWEIKKFIFTHDEHYIFVSDFIFDGHKDSIIICDSSTDYTFFYYDRKLLKIITGSNSYYNIGGLRDSKGMFLPGATVHKLDSIETLANKLPVGLSIYDPPPFFTRIDHVPVVVTDIQAVKKLLHDKLGFTIKEGRHHEGIYNCFIKFGDGTYLEFVMPEDTLHEIGKYYTHFLQQRQGGTAMAIAVSNIDSAAIFFNAMHIPFRQSANRVWKTITPSNIFPELFFIEYANKNWKDTEKNTSHKNGGNQLLSTWYAVKDLDKAKYHFRMLGCQFTGQWPAMLYWQSGAAIGNDTLVLVRPKQKTDPAYPFVKQYGEGICGFTIKVQSLDAVKSLLAEKQVLTEKGFEDKSILVRLNEYNLFIEFTE